MLILQTALLGRLLSVWEIPFNTYSLVKVNLAMKFVASIPPISTLGILATQHQ
jgi:hypothetical protein